MILHVEVLIEGKKHKKTGDRGMGGLVKRKVGLALTQNTHFVR